MAQKRRALLAAVVLSAQLAVGVLTASTAHAATGPADDRQLDAPTSWWTYTGVTASTLSSLLATHGARLTDLHADGETPTFTATMVANTGSYASAWWWYYGITASQVSATLATNHARLISLDTYNTPVGVRFDVVMVPNSGANAKAWWWYYGVTPTQIKSRIATNHARLIQLSPYGTSTSTYTAIMVDNTSTDATSWWWYYHVSPTTLGSLVGTNHARLVDLSHNADGSFNAIMYGGAQPRWYWYYGQNLSTAVSRAVQQGERVIDVTHYGDAYAVVETRNTNSLSETLWDTIGPVVPTGNYGFYLKQVGGPVYAGVEQSRGYEPASALKVLYHAKSIHAESLGQTHDGDTITYAYDPANPAYGGICPDNFTTTSTTTLMNADEQMMWNSDNRMTKGILFTYGGGTFAGGKSVMESYGASLGLTNTHINHDIGCPTSTTHNITTLVDLGKVYEAFQNGTVTTSAAWKAQFRARMLNESNYPGFRSSICPTVQSIAASLGKSAATATAFCNALTWIAKGGSYQYGGALPATVSWDGLSMTGVPFKSRGVVVPRYYVFGEYIDGTTINSTTQANTINAARSNEYREAMSPFLRAALATW